MRVSYIFSHSGTNVINDGSARARTPVSSALHSPRQKNTSIFTTINPTACRYTSRGDCSWIGMRSYRTRLDFSRYRPLWNNRLACIVCYINTYTLGNFYTLRTSLDATSGMSLERDIEMGRQFLLQIALFRGQQILVRDE